MYSIDFYEYAYKEFLVDAETGKVYGLDAYNVDDDGITSLLDWVLADVQTEEPAQVEIELCGQKSYLAWNCKHSYIICLFDWLASDFITASDVEDEDERKTEAKKRDYGLDEIAPEDVRIISDEEDE